VHALDLHVFPAPQTVPQVLQLLGSEVVSTHAVPHSFDVGAVQLMVHEVPLHAATPLPAVGPGHAEPQTPPLPQPLAGLGAWQVPPQSSIPLGHLHSLLWQVVPPEHAVVQLPQYSEFVVVSTQLPLQSVGVDPRQPVTQE
jgi:hypothetical protein